MTRRCEWCTGPMPIGARADAITCSKVCRQAKHRASVRRAELEETAHPKRLAYADPPYVGLAARYYADHPDFGGEVDHVSLLETLRGYDGWALSCSSRSLPGLSALALRAGHGGVRIAIWHRRRPDGWQASRFEGVLYVPARSSATPDVLIGVDAPRRPTLPGDVTGIKPPEFCTWLFALLGARPGDTLRDLFPGSGMVRRSWELWVGLGETLPMFPSRPADDGDGQEISRELDMAPA